MSSYLIAKMPVVSKRTLTSKQKSMLLDDAVFYEILFALGVSKHDEFDYCVWEHLNFSRMGHARALMYFFEQGVSSEKKWPDDLVSEDFGFPASQIGLDREDLDRLNKDLFHLIERCISNVMIHRVQGKSEA